MDQFSDFFRIMWLKFQGFLMLIFLIFFQNNMAKISRFIFKKNGPFFLFFVDHVTENLGFFKIKNGPFS